MWTYLGGDGVGVSSIVFDCRYHNDIVKERMDHLEIFMGTDYHYTRWVATG